MTAKKDRLTTTIGTVENIFLEKVSKSYKVSKVKILDSFVKFFQQNEYLLTADFFEKSEFNDLKSLQEDFILKFKEHISDTRGDDFKMINDLFTKQINRLIGFIKVQDNTIRMETAKIRLTLDPMNYELYHPFFDQFLFINDCLKDFIQYKVGENVDFYPELFAFIKQNRSAELLKDFKEFSSFLESRQF